MERMLNIKSGEELNITMEDITHFCKQLKQEDIRRGLNIEKNIISESNRYGPAVNYCYGFNGKLFVGGGEYESEVNYCPICGEPSSSE